MWGLISADGSEATPLAVPDAEDGALSIIRGLAHGQALPAAAGPRLPVSAITLRAPLPRPQRNLFCVGRKTITRMPTSSPARCSATTRWQKDGVADRVLRPAGNRDRPARHGATAGQGGEHTDRLRVRLAVVIGLGGRDIARSRAMEHVFGYTVVNDVSARDVQVRHGQWHLAELRHLMSDGAVDRHRR